MPKKLNLAGTRFSRLLVLDEHPIRNGGKVCWECICDCGQKCYPSGTNLKTGNSTSCGCFKQERSAAAKTTHGFSKNVFEYRIWKNMKSRCLNQRNPAFKNYGSRGIAVCDRWKNSFQNFLSDMGRRPSTNHSIDRIDNNGNYEPGNCRWATEFEQSNNKSSTVIIDAHKKPVALTMYLRFLGIPGLPVYKLRHRYPDASMQDIINFQLENLGKRVRFRAWLKTRTAKPLPAYVGTPSDQTAPTMWPQAPL